MQNTAKILIIAGILLCIAGIILYFAGNKFNLLGHLPGDIRIEKENFKLYIPITTMILISIFVSLILKIIQRFF